MRFRATIRCLVLTAVAVLAGVGLGACSGEPGESNVASEHGITQDINAVHGRSPTALPSSERLVEDWQVPRREPSAAAASNASAPPSGVADVSLPPKPGNPRAGHDFAIGTCTPCHVVSTNQKSPVRFANAPDFRAIANAPRTTAIGLNIWLTNPHPTMPKLVLYSQEAADVIAYILSLRDQR